MKYKNNPRRNKIYKKLYLCFLYCQLWTFYCARFSQLLFTTLRHGSQHYKNHDDTYFK